MATPHLRGHTPKGFLQGTHRTVPPSETLARLLPLLASYGITRLANVTELDEIGIPVVLAIRPNARSLSVAQGKGVDLAASKVSAVMESLEQHHAEHDNIDVRWACYQDLAPRARVVEPSDLPQLGRGADRRAKLLWTQAFELESETPWWVPYELVHLNFTLPLPPGSGHFLGGSNGLASGNHPLEAAVHAVTELIERDALALLYRQPASEQQRRRLDLTTVQDELCRSLLARFEQAGVAVAVWDATSDLEVPVYLCDVVDRETNLFRPLGSARGAGCHVEPAVALARALTEAAQSRLTRITGSRDDLQSAHVELHRSAAKIAADRARILAPQGREQEHGQGTSLASPGPSFASFEEELAFLRERLRSVGAGPILTVDLSPEPSSPQGFFHVLRVIVPGLEGSSDNPGYRPGRRATAAAARSSSPSTPVSPALQESP